MFQNFDMKKIIYLIIFISYYSIIFAQNTKWEITYGNPNQTEGARALIEDYDNGYFIGGYSGYNGLNLKSDINGTVLYDRILEHELVNISVWGAATDDNGNKYICGSRYNDITWPYIIKLDPCGELVWCKLLDNDLFEDGTVKDIIVNKNNEIVVLVKYDSEEEIDVIHLVGLNTYGDILWTNPYASKNDYSWIREPSAYSLEEINNEYYISGFCYWPYPDDTTHWFLRPLFIGIDSLFEEKWILPFLALDSIYGDAFKTIAINDSVFMGVGVRRGYEDNAILMFYNKNGVELGYKEILNDQIGQEIKGSDIRNIVRINEDLFMTASQFGPDFSGNPYGELIIDTAGNIYNLQSHPNTVSFIPGLIKTYDNNYVIATSIEETKGDKDIYVYKIDQNLNDVPFDPTPHNYDSLCPGGIQSGTIDLSDCLVWTNIGNAPSPQEYYQSIKQIPIKAYPNPATKGKITFEFENTEHHNNMELKCFDLYGKEIFSEKVYKYQTEAIVDITKLKQGMYVAVVYSNGWPVGECKFVVQ